MRNTKIVNSPVSAIWASSAGVADLPGGRVQVYSAVFHENPCFLPVNFDTPLPYVPIQILPLGPFLMQLIH